MTADTQAQGDLAPLPPTSYVLATEGDGYSEPRVWSWAGYDDEAMREYGRACVAAALQGRAQEGEPSDERAAFEEWFIESFDIPPKTNASGEPCGNHSGPAWGAWKARADLAQAQKERNHG